MAKRVGCGDRSADRNGEANADWSMKEIAGASKQRDSGGTSTNVPLLLASNRVRHQTQLLLATGTGFHCLGTRPYGSGRPLMEALHSTDEFGPHSELAGRYCRDGARLFSG